MKHKYYNDLTSWASDAVDAGHIISPDSTAPRKEYKATDKNGKVVGRYSYMQGETGPYETGSLPLHEDAGGGISAGAVSGGPVTHSAFAPVIGPKLSFIKKVKKTKKKLTETILFQDAKLIVYKNPSTIEFKRIRSDRKMGTNQLWEWDIACVLFGNDAYFWIPPTYHAHVVPMIASRIGADVKDAIPLRVYADDTNSGDMDIHVMVTDYSENTKWFRNPKVAEAIRHNGYLSKFNIEDVGYFDVAIVGNWDDIPA